MSWKRRGDKRCDGGDGGFWMTRKRHIYELICNSRHSPCQTIREWINGCFAGGYEDEWNAPFIAGMRRDIGRTERYPIQPSPGRWTLRVETNQTRTTRSPGEEVAGRQLLYIYSRYCRRKSEGEERETRFSVI